ncbi:AAA family ATPase [Streptomyces sp. NPDC002764]|uniref:ATP-binding protein n=1 Tax=Streptomyces sp. NPDC002764 TaxID=3154428 RepID=UPI0033333ED0
MANAGSIVGREWEVGELAGLVASTEGRALVLRGEPGVGKSALLDVAAARAAELGQRVVRAAGVEAEAGLAFAGLHQLLHPLLADAGALDPATRAAFDIVFGRSTGEPPSVMALGIAVLDLLALASGDVPLLLVVDDAHWLDPQSAEAARFIARRLSGYAVRMAVGVRADTPSPWDGSGLPELTVSPLSPEASARLLDASSPGLAEPARRRILDQARGNPLALLELPAALDGSADRPELPLSRRLERLYGDRIARLDGAERAELLRAALDGTGAAALPGRARYPLGAVDGAVAHGLLTTDADTGDLVFRHPLVRSALLQSATPNERRAAHADLARLHREELERHATHLAAATVDPDESVAVVLERAARSATARGGSAAALTLLTRAAELSPTAAQRSRRLGEAAYVAAQSALLDQAHELREASDRLAGTGRSPTAVITYAYTALYEDGDVRSAHRRVAAELKALPSDADEEIRARLLNLLLAISVFSADPALWRVSDALMDRDADRVDGPTPLYRDAWGDVARRGAGARERVLAAFGRLGDGQPWDVMRLGVAAYYLDALAEHRTLVRRVAERETGSGAVTNAMTLQQLVMLDQMSSGEWDAAEETGRRGLALTVAHGYRLFEHQYHGFLGLLAAWRGDADTARAALDRVDRWARPRGVGYLTQLAEATGAALGLTTGDYESAYAYAGGLTAPGTFTPYSQQAVRMLLDLVEAAVHTGRLDQARTHALAARDQGLPAISPRLAFLTTAVLAMTAEDTEAGPLFERAVAHPAGVDFPFELARVRLEQGMWLRRTHDRTTARTALGLAAETFERLGATPWLRRAQAELRASGLPGEPTATGAALTPQERQIADLAASGLSNKEIGARLFLSPRTVGAHLYRIFPKLGISSRASLRDALEGI